MKYIRRRKDKSNINHFDVQIRLAGERPIYNSFFTKVAAEKFVRQTLVAFDEGKLNHHQDRKTFSELAHIYLNEIAINYSSSNEQATIYVVNRMVKELPPHPIKKDILQYRDRLKTVKALDTVRKRITTIRLIYQHAINEKLILIDDPTQGIKTPSYNNCRNRRPTFSELKILYREASPNMWLLIKLAIKTCMRRSELLDPTKKIQKVKNGYLIKLKTHKTVKKTGEKTVPISIKSKKLFDTISATKKEAFKSQWRRLLVKTKIKNLRFHDFRHEGISRLFEKGWSIQEVALVSGHQSWSSLKRYTNLKEELILKKL